MIVKWWEYGVGVVICTDGGSVAFVNRVGPSVRIRCFSSFHQSGDNLVFFTSAATDR